MLFSIFISLCRLNLQMSRIHQFDEYFISIFYHYFMYILLLYRIPYEQPWKLYCAFRTFSEMVG